MSIMYVMVPVFIWWLTDQSVYTWAYDNTLEKNYAPTHYTIFVLHMYLNVHSGRHKIPAVLQVVI